jgi:hypothetical protein
MKFFDDLLAWVVPDRDKCRNAADELRAKAPTATPEQLARRAITEAKRWGAVAGGSTGAAANPLIMIPAAFADMGAMLKIEGQMVGVIAALFDPSSTLDEQRFQADVLTVVFPGAVSQALRQVGLHASQRITRSLIQKYLSEDLVKQTTSFAGKFLMLRVSKKAIISKTVPIVGAGVGAAWNWVELAGVGKRAIRYYQSRAIGPMTAPADAPVQHVTVRTVSPLAPPVIAPPTLPPPSPPAH